MQFSFLSPAAFSLLLALPLLLVPYLLRQRYQRRVVPALFLYQDISSPVRRRLWGRIRLSPLFLLQLLILLLLVAIAARPVLQYDTAGKIALVLDTSASMQARDPSGQGSVFEAAKEKIQQELANIPQSAPSASSRPILLERSPKTCLKLILERPSQPVLIRGPFWSGFVSAMRPTRALQRSRPSWPGSCALTILSVSCL